jgi:hypothetical protein
MNAGLIRCADNNAIHAIACPVKGAGPEGKSKKRRNTKKGDSKK